MIRVRLGFPVRPPCFSGVREIGECPSLRLSATAAYRAWLFADRSLEFEHVVYSHVVQTLITALWPASSCYVHEMVRGFPTRSPGRRRSYSVLYVGCIGSYYDRDSRACLVLIPPNRGDRSNHQGRTQRSTGDKPKLSTRELFTSLKSIHHALVNSR